MEHLKAKVEAGADLIVTQLFYSTTLFVDYVKRCRAAGVKVLMEALSRVDSLVFF